RKSACLRSGSISECAIRHLFHVSTPCLSISRCSGFAIAARSCLPRLDALILAQTKMAEKRKAARCERPCVYIEKVALVLVAREPLFLDAGFDAALNLQAARNGLVVVPGFPASWSATPDVALNLQTASHRLIMLWMAPTGLDVALDLQTASNRL